MNTKNLNRQSKRNRLEIEKLEERWTPAQFGIPWPDATHLTLSFVPDGTQIQTESSQLQNTLDAQMSRNTWRTAIVRAFQMWSEVANVNVGVVTDGGQPLGTAGATQGDMRFGDIRIAGLPMVDNSAAVSIPPSNATTGTFAGDLIFNTNQTFDTNKLLSAALHEAGHILGLDHSTDSTSVMFPTLVGNTVLSAGDIANIRALYGVHPIDSNEIAKFNDTLANATRVKFSVSSSGYNGSTPVVEYGDISNPSDIDYFYVPNLDTYSGPISFRVQTTGISMLTPKISIVDRDGRILATKVGAGITGSVTTITIPSSIAGARYYLRVEASPTATFKTGRFGVGVTFDALLKPTAISLNNVLRGPYEQLAPEKIDQLFKNASSILDDDLHLNDDINNAITLKPNASQPSDKDYQVIGSLSDSTDFDYYRVKAPDTVAGVSTWVMTVSVRGEGSNPVIPKIEIFDSRSVLVPAEVIVNGNGELTVQAVNITPNRAYFMRIASDTGATGNYDLHVQFGSTTAELNEFAAGDLTAAGTAESTLYVAKSQLFSFLLTSTLGSAPVTMTISDLAGNIVHQQTVNPSQSSSGISKLLTPGQYRVAFSSAAPASFRLRGSRITDPVGTVYTSPTFAPQYTPDPLLPIYIFPYLPLTPVTTPYLFTPVTMVG